MKLPVLKQDAPKQAQPGKGPGALAKKLLRKRVVIPAAVCVLVGAFVLRLAGGGRPVSAADLTYTTAAVERRDSTDHRQRHAGGGQLLFGHLAGGGEHPHRRF